jgi:hypothetical protein
MQYIALGTILPCLGICLTAEHAFPQKRTNTSHSMGPTYASGYPPFHHCSFHYFYKPYLQFDLAGMAMKNPE